MRFSKEHLLEQIAQATELRARDGCGLVARSVYENVVNPLAEALEEKDKEVTRLRSVIQASSKYIVVLENQLNGQRALATDSFLAEARVQAHKEGAYFVANRMLAAWEAGFIDDTAKNAADIARMILSSTEFMADAPEGDFDRSFADGVLEDIAAQFCKGAES